MVACDSTAFCAAGTGAGPAFESPARCEAPHCLCTRLSLHQLLWAMPLWKPYYEDPSQAALDPYFGYMNLMIYIIGCFKCTKTYIQVCTFLCMCVSENTTSAPTRVSILGCSLSWNALAMCLYCLLLVPAAAAECKGCFGCFSMPSVWPLSEAGSKVCWSQWEYFHGSCWSLGLLDVALWSELTWKRGGPHYCHQGECHLKPRSTAQGYWRNDCHGNFPRGRVGFSKVLGSRIYCNNNQGKKK